MSSDSNVKEIIAQLQRLQLEQNVLILRLAHANERESGQGATNERESNHGATDTVIPPDATREFVVGDRVRIKNPGRFQANNGTITKIGASRITVQTKSGAKISRAPKNLDFEDE